jgi:hypothetical protein
MFDISMPAQGIHSENDIFWQSHRNWIIGLTASARQSASGSASLQIQNCVYVKWTLGW